ncbi:MAG: nucleoid occlusion factor SlmA [Rhodoferax sp.]
MKAPCSDTAVSPDSPPFPAGRARPAPGQRRLEILQVLARMLEQPGAQRITTAALAEQLQVSEAALYRHFASKAQMFEALLDFIEESVLGMVQRVTQQAPQGWAQGQAQCAQIVGMVLQFAHKNPGLARVMAADALAHEHPRLQERMQRCWDKLEAALRQVLRDAALAQPQGAPAGESAHQAAVLVAYACGQTHRYVRSGFRHSPSAHWAQHAGVLLGCHGAG